MQPGVQLYQRTYLTVLSFILGLALVVSLLLNLYQLYLSGAVYFVTVGTGQRLVRPGELPEATIRNFAKDFIRLIGNGTPAGLDQNWHDAGAYLSQKALADFSDARAKQLEWIHRGNISLTTETLEVVRVEKLSNRLAHQRLTITATQIIVTSAAQYPVCATAAP